MELFYRELGEGQNLVIMHGLYGASDNWVRIAKQLATKFKIYLPDLRNHGASPHSDEFSIKVMTEDLLEFINSRNIEKTILIGHSLGGKVAMEFASLYPEKIEKLIIVDIAPRNYVKEEFVQKNNHQEIINTLKNVDLSKYSNRKAALEDIVKIDPTKRLMFFMMKNIKKGKTGNLLWKININAIADNLTTILNEFSADLTKISCPTLFIKGEKSPYLSQSDFDYISSKIKNVKFEIIQDATHWVHGEKPDEFTKVVDRFL
jgi:esterase